MNEGNSDVTLTPIDANNFSLQNLVFFGGKLWNQNLKKYLSVNSGLVRADSNTTVGASTWKLGNGRHRDQGPIL
jgi:hypothetical protein